MSELVHGYVPDLDWLLDEDLSPACDDFPFNCSNGDSAVSVLPGLQKFGIQSGSSAHSQAIAGIPTPPESDFHGPVLSEQQECDAPGALTQGLSRLETQENVLYGTRWPISDPSMNDAAGPVAGRRRKRRNHYDKGFTQAEKEKDKVDKKERNRVAAEKTRAKKKASEADLQHQIAYLRASLAQANAEVQELGRQLAQLTISHPLTHIPAAPSGQAAQYNLSQVVNTPVPNGQAGRFNFRQADNTTAPNDQAAQSNLSQVGNAPAPNSQTGHSYPAGPRNTGDQLMNMNFSVFGDSPSSYF